MVEDLGIINSANAEDRIYSNNLRPIKKGIIDREANKTYVYTGTDS